MTGNARARQTATPRLAQCAPQPALPRLVRMHDAARPARLPALEPARAIHDVLVERVGKARRELVGLERVVAQGFIWSREETAYGLETNLIDVYVRRLRRKFERPGSPPLIRTIRGTGYQLA